MTLNDLERRNGYSPYFTFFSPNSIALRSDYVIVVEDRPIVSVNIVSQFQSSTCKYFAASVGPYTPSTNLAQSEILRPSYWRFRKFFMPD